MIRSLALAALATLAVVLAACSSGGSAASPAPLGGTSWTVASIGGTTVAGTAPTMIFGADGTVTGTTGCNQYNATFKTDGSNLTVDPIASTRMFCEGDGGANEAAFTPALQGAKTYAIGSDGKLTISGAGDIVATSGVAASAAPAAGLPGTSWVVTGDLATQAGEKAPTLSFSQDGIASGNSGCNSYTGSYTVDGSSLTFGQMASTMMACEEPLMTVESTFLAALGGATSYTIGDDGNLTIEGSSTLTFAPAAA